MNNIDYDVDYIDTVEIIKSIKSVKALRIKALHLLHIIVNNKNKLRMCNTTHKNKTIKNLKEDIKKLKSTIA